ncbi:MAG: hypothetical protein CMF59_12645 [Leptospiraceae bacterium]|nr:hypothetical protein [Leptospiraceae bacterium]
MIQDQHKDGTESEIQEYIARIQETAYVNNISLELAKKLVDASDKSGDDLALPQSGVLRRKDGDRYGRNQRGRLDLPA